VSSSLDADQLIEMLGLEPLPREGGYFRQTFHSGEVLPVEVLPDGYRRPRSLVTAIFYLLTPDTFSALHALPTDEIYHFYLGDTVEMLLLHPEGRSEWIHLGQDLAGGERIQWVVPREVWQGSRLVSGGRWALLGTTMAPGWDEEDYRPGDREELVRRYPERAPAILELTR
jgi:hypothetical protein